MRSFAVVVSFLFFAVALRGSEPFSAFQTSAVTIEGIVAFTEGPAWHPSHSVYFSDIHNDRIMRCDRDGEMHVYRTPSGRSNGLAFDRQGRLVACEGGGPGSARRVTRTEPDGTTTVLADQFEGHRLNSPNDLTIDSLGRIYFSDPRYRDRSDLEQFDTHGKSIDGVYRIDTDGSLSRIMTHEVDRPNGLAVSPDDKYLFVADNVNDGPNNGFGGNRKLWRFQLNRDGTLDPSSQTLLFDWGTERGPDGMAIDVENRLYVAAGCNMPTRPSETSKLYKSGIYVITTDGQLVDFIAVPEDMVTNCCFGGDDRKTLFITAGHKLWSVRVKTKGHVVMSNE